MKKVIYLSLTIILSFILVNNIYAFSPDPYFDDVPDTHWAFEYVQRLYEEEITSGCDTNLFCPTNYVTRGQMAVLLVRTVEGEPPDGYCDTSVPFNDVLPPHWACKYIKRLKELGVTFGCGNGNYCLYNNVTRAEMALFIIRAKYGEDFSYTSTPHFSDVPDTHWAFRYIQKMKDDNITTGC